MTIKRILTAGRRPGGGSKTPTIEQTAAVGPAFRPGGAQPASEKPYTPPANFPADPKEFLAVLQTQLLTPEQVAYLRSNALTQYVAAINAARVMPGTAEVVALGDRIIAAWIARLSELGPAPAGNPFQLAGG